MVDQERRSRAVRQYRAGATLREVAAAAGVDNTTVGRWLTAAGVRPRPRGARPLADVRDQTIRDLRLRGRSWSQIAEEVGMSPSGVRRRYHTGTAPRG